jgi:hypothetical protein
MNMKSWVLALGLAALSGTAQAATLNFEGNICGGGTSCTNGESIDQSYGDITGVDVEYDGSPGTVGLQNFAYWFDAYSDLLDVAYYSGGATLTLLADAGYSVFLDSLDLGAWPNVDRSVGFTVTDLFDSSEVFTTGGPIIVDGDVRSSFNLGLSSIVGLKITFLGDFFNGGVDNVVYSARPNDPGNVPLPAGVWLLGTALAGLAATRRRKSKT